MIVEVGCMGGCACVSLAIMEISYVIIISDVIVIFSLLEEPSAPPANVISSGITNTTLAFQWDRVPCGYRGGPNKFKYELTDEGGTSKEGDTSDLTATIDDLIPCKKYSFRVQAFNDAGNGNFSSAINRETDIGGKRTVRLFFFHKCIILKDLFL